MLGTECSEMSWQTWLLVTTAIITACVAVGVLIARWGWK